MACQICGAKSGFYPLCKDCFKLKDEGKITKCEECGIWKKDTKPLCYECWLKNNDAKKKSTSHKSSELEIEENNFRSKFPATIRAEDGLENAYEAMREAADALLYLDGFKSYSHEASIAYLLRKGFGESEIIEIDRFRKIRNGIKYYGRDCNLEDAKL